MQLSEAIFGRRAVREYSNEPVDEPQVMGLISAAVQAPSAMNRQPWSFCVVRNQEILTQISNEAKSHLLRSTPVGLVSHHFEETLRDPAFHIFYHAPVLIVISATEDSEWGAIDCALAAENLMLAAYDSGLGSCWIGFAQGWLGTHEGKAILDLPANYIPVAPIIVGRPVNTPPPVPRREPEIRLIG
jgi:nitroreductase